MDEIIQALTQYYGLDWLAFFSGIGGMYLITQKSRWGFALSILCCMAGFTVAAMSMQFGFVVYNAILIAVMSRGYINWAKAE